MAYLLRHNKLHWIATIPAMFMTTVVITFLLNSSTLGAGLPMTVSTIAGVVTTLVITALLIVKTKGKIEIDLPVETELKETVKDS